MVGRGLLAGLPRLLGDWCPAHAYAVITDSRVAELYGARVLAGLRDAGLRATLFPFPAGEWNKTRATWTELTDALLEDCLKSPTKSKPPSDDSKRRETFLKPSRA